MTIQSVNSFAAGQWIKADDSAREIYSAVTGELIARAGNSRLDTDSMLDYARTHGGQVHVFARRCRAYQCVQFSSVGYVGKTSASIASRGSRNC